jgi:hypothetical protein
MMKGYVFHFCNLQMTEDYPPIPRLNEYCQRAVEYSIVELLHGTTSLLILSFAILLLTLRASFGSGMRFQGPRGFLPPSVSPPFWGGKKSPCLGIDFWACWIAISTLGKYLRL